MSVFTSKDDAAMIRTYGAWPLWPCLPLKRKNNELKQKNLGFLLATQQHKDAVRGKGVFVVYHGYMFDLPEDQEGFDALPRTEYATIEEMLSDGWMVD